MFRIGQSLDDIVPKWRKDYLFDYQAFGLIVCIMVKDKFLQLFVGLDVGKGYSDVTLSWNGAVINKNGNRCKVTKWTYTYPDPQELLRGDGAWIDTSNLHTYVNSKRELEINITITSCEFKHNEAKMIQGIYEKLFGQDEFYLIRYKNTIQTLQTELQKSHEVNNNLTLLLEESTKSKADSSSSSSSSPPIIVASAASSSSSSGSVIDKIKSIDPDDLDTETLNSLQEIMQSLQINITKRIKELETCSICMENKINCIIIPCGHRYCMTCIDTIKKGENKCPSCRKTITESHKTY